MLQTHRSWIAVIAAALALAHIGCSSEPSREPAARPNAKKHVALPVDNNASTPQASNSGQDHAVVKQKPANTHPLPTIPKVDLNAELLAGSLVRVGDQMPSTKRPALLGGAYSLTDLFGEKLTVVCFWSVTTFDRKRMAGVVKPEAKRAVDETLQFLLKEIAEPFSPKGGYVRVVDINVGDPLEDVKRVPLAFANGDGPLTVNFAPGRLAPMIVNDAPAAMHRNNDGTETVVIYNDLKCDMLPCLLDTDRELFSRIATDGKTPRVYLLDAKGKILWFDVGFSRSARKNLLRAVRALLDRG
jgi:hypothetical protein